jgi:hypothetical protein
MSNLKALQQIVNSGVNPYKAQLDETRKLVKKWKPTGLLEGLKNENDVHSMSLLLENQAKQLIDESNRTGGDSAEQWAGVALPLVRRIFGELSAKEFVSVQPMNLPSGLIFFLDFKYGSGAQPGFTQDKSIYGGTGAQFGRTDDTVGGLYGPGRFGYTINNYVTSAFGNASGTVTAWKDIQFVPELSASLSAGALHYIDFQFLTAASIDPQGVRAFEASGNVGGAFLPAFTSVSTTTSPAGYLVRFYHSGSSMFSTSSALTVSYHKQPTDSSRGDFEDQYASGSQPILDIPEVDVAMKSEPITAKTRKLKAVWTPELAQDLNAYHSIDAEAELTSILSEYISMEIDLEILDMLMLNASTVDYWSARIGWEWDAVTSTFKVAAAASSLAYQQPTWFQTIGTKIQKMSNRIHQLTMRGGANFIVTSPSVATILESIPGYVANTDGKDMQFAMGVAKVGSFASRFTVYKNPYMTENVMLVGFRGSNFLETGAVYAPYIPLIMTPIIYDPNNFTPRKGVLTRYAKKIVRPEFYGKIVIDGLNTI